GHLLGPLGAPNDRLRFLEKALADAREHDTAGLAREQACPKRRFQGLDLGAQRQRRDPELRGRAREMQLLGDGHEVSQMSELHRGGTLRGDVSPRVGRTLWAGLREVNFRLRWATKSRPRARILLQPG